MQMDKFNTVLIILTIAIIVGILFLTISARTGAGPLIDETQQNSASMLSKPQEVRETTPSNLSERPNSEMKQYQKAPEMLIDSTKKYSAVITTSEGEITLDLNTQETPITANNFVFLANESFYDNTIFHRVINGFMIQGGDPLGNGTGGPGYKFPDEKFDGEYTRGTVAMANSGPNTNGSQFFIMHNDYPLAKNFVIFGKVSGGLDVVDKIATAPAKLGMDGQNSSPINPVKIISVEVVEE